MSQNTESLKKRRITVDADALYEVLKAFEGPTHLLLELKVTVSLDALGRTTRPTHPLSILADEWNEFLKAEARLKKQSLEETNP